MEAVVFLPSRRRDQAAFRDLHGVVKCGIRRDVVPYLDDESLWLLCLHIWFLVASIIHHPPHHLHHLPPATGRPAFQPDDDLREESEQASVGYPGCVGGLDGFVGVGYQCVHRAGWNFTASTKDDLICCGVMSACLVLSALPWIQSL
jgi:hypothetical protein